MGALDSPELLQGTRVCDGLFSVIPSSRATSRVPPSGAVMLKTFKRFGSLTFIYCLVLESSFRAGECACAKVTGEDQQAASGASG